MCRISFRRGESYGAFKGRRRGERETAFNDVNTLDSELRLRLDLTGPEV